MRKAQQTSKEGGIVSCAVCGRDTRGLGFQLPGLRNAPMRRACSPLCLDILCVKGGDVLELTHFERQAVEAASDAAGEYLERVGKTDLAIMSRDEWQELLKGVFLSTTGTIQRLSDEAAVPF